MTIATIPPQSVPPLDNRGGDATLPPLFANSWWLPLNSLFGAVKTIDDTVSAMKGFGIIFDTHANRANFAPASYPGRMYFETDRYVIYGCASVPSATVPEFQWVYIAGEMFATQATLPTDLGLYDAQFLVTVDDYGHRLRWNAVIPGWEWAPGDGGSGMMVEFEIDPTGPGWQLYDGTANVPYLKSDGTLGTVTLPDLVSAANKAAYVKAGSPNAAPAAAIAPTITAEPTVGTPSATTVVAAGAGTTVASASHIHTLSGGTISATGEPRQITRRPWFRK